VSQPKKHHYVPQCYLKNFRSENGGPLFTLNIEHLKKNYNTKIKSQHPGAICYINNYYSIKDKLIFSGELKAIDFVEKIVNHYYEDSYQSVFEKLINDQSISLEDAMFVSDFLVHLKIRNPFQIGLNENLKIEKIIQVAQGRYSSLKNEAIKWGFSSVFFDSIYENEIIKLINKESLTKDFQLESLVQKFTNPEKNLALFREAILSCQWTLIESKNDQELFITTDNPGIAIDIFGNTHNTKFANGFNFFFPISPKYTLEISDSKKDHLRTNKKEIKGRSINSKLVRGLNHLFTKVSTRYLIANNARTLQNFIDL
jgi:hypothetical protein